MRNQEHLSSPEDNGNPPITKLKVTEFCDLADKEFAIAVLRKPNKL